MEVIIYESELGLDIFSEDIGMVYISISMEMLYGFFKENILENFRSDVDKDISDLGVFEEWLDEYTADDTTGLYEYAIRNKEKPKVTRIF